MWKQTSKLFNLTSYTFDKRKSHLYINLSHHDNRYSMNTKKNYSWHCIFNNRDSMEQNCDHRIDSTLYLFILIL